MIKKGKKLINPLGRFDLHPNFVTYSEFSHCLGSRGSKLRVQGLYHRNTKQLRSC